MGSADITAMNQSLTATCHCGAIAIAVARPPAELTDCNCSLCRAYGIIWAYYETAEIAIPENVQTDTYAWNGRHVDFHRCRTCGCVTHWIPRKESRSRRGINANLMPLEAIASARIRHRDGAGTGKYLD